MVDWSAPPDEASTRRLLYDVVLGFLVVLSPTALLIGEQTVVWPWIGYGMGTTLVGYAVSRTAIGHRAETWFTRIGTEGRFLCIIAAVICIWGGIWTIEPHIPSLMSFVCGSAILLLGASVFRLCNRILAQ